jgi:hypothetical protein
MVGPSRLDLRGVSRSSRTWKRDAMEVVYVKRFTQYYSAHLFAQRSAQGTKVMIGQIIDVVVFTPIFMVLSIAFLVWQRRAAEIYVIWYINSFFFLLFYVVGLFTEIKGVGLLSVCGSYKDACNYVYGMLTNADEEMILMLILFGLALGPQMLAYLLSGLSGSAYAPSYVSEITSAVMWSIIKFTAGLAGILVAAWFAKLTVGHPVTYDEFKNGFSWLPMSFLFAAAHLLYTKQIPAMVREDFQNLTWLHKLHKLFTAFVPPEPPKHPHSLRRRALIALLESDAVYDYLTQDQQTTETVTQPEAPGGNEAR